MSYKIKYVIALNYGEFSQWAKQKGLAKHPSHADGISHKYVRNPESLIGISNPEGIFVGRYKERKDIIQIVDLLLKIKPEGPTKNKIYSLYYELLAMAGVAAAAPAPNPSTITINIGHPGSGGTGVGGILGGSGTVYSVGPPGAGGSTV